MSDHLSLLVIGPHPDDCSIKAGGIAAHYVAAGHDVTFLTITDGSAGHHEMDRTSLAARRKLETDAVAETLGVTYDWFGIRDGEVTPTLSVRERLIRYTRRVDPDLVLGPRPNDYHPDHRYTAQLIRDAAYMLIVPNVCSDVEPLDSMPVIGYVADGFTKPTPFDPDVVVDVSAVEPTKLDAIHCHESQVYEWLPYTFNDLDAVPAGDAERRAWLAADGVEHLVSVTEMNVADRFRDRLRARYGADADEITHAEAVEISEYGAPLDPAARDTLFFV